MEMRGHDKYMGMPNSNSLACNEHNNREPLSSTLSTSSLIPSLDRQHVCPSQLTSNLQQQARRDPDPASAIATNCGATSTQIGSGSQVRPPQQIQPTETTTVPTVRYRECLKNHAANMGTHVLDGCGEFMPSGDDGTPEALKCAACDCHRNFHRKEVNGESQYVANCYYNPNRNSSRRDTTTIQRQTSLSQHHRVGYSYGLPISPSTLQVPTMMMAFGGNGGAPAESSSEDLNLYQSRGGVQPSGQPALGKKRVRTKFTQEQKDKMMEFCEKLGWKIQKQDEEQLQRFCSEVGIRRQVFKVWMHNNKQAMKRAIVRHDS